MERTRLTLFALALIMPILLVVGLATAVVSPTAHAAPANTITVTTLNDSGAGSLRQAIADVDTGGTIDFDISGTIVLESELVIDQDLAIQGNIPITISGNNATRVFNVTAGNVTFDSLTIISGTVQTTDCGGLSAECGGGIMLQNSGVAVTVTHSTLSGNSTPFGGGGIANYQGTLTVNDSTFSDNSALFGGGIYNNDSTMTVNNSTFSGNVVSRGGGIYNNSTAAVTHSIFSDNLAESGGGIYNSGGTLTVTNSTFTRNDANWGGGIYNNESTVTVNNSTLANNSAFLGGGIYSNTLDGSCSVQPHTLIHNSTLSGNLARGGGGGIRNEKGVVEISHSTITTNTAVMGGGVSSANNDTTCTRVGGTIIASNPSGHDVTADDTTQRFFSLGHNLIGTAGENVDFAQEFTATGDMTNTLPLLAPLADNGGPTLTHALLPGSPALDAGNCTSGPATDQRGVARPQDETCDIGAVEMVLDSFEMIYLPLVVR